MGEAWVTVEPTRCPSRSTSLVRAITFLIAHAQTIPRWLGQNSKQGKLSRQLGEVQIHMRLKVSGDKTEIRQSYLPALFPYIVKPLVDDGSVGFAPLSSLSSDVHFTQPQSAVNEIIERMDEYYLSREDWDTLVELGVDQNKDEIVLKKISASTKTSFTKK